MDVDTDLQFQTKYLSEKLILPLVSVVVGVLLSVGLICFSLPVGWSVKLAGLMIISLLIGWLIWRLLNQIALLNHYKQTLQKNLHCYQQKLVQNDLSQLPVENPNPILRISREGQLSYANPASQILQKHWQISLDEPLPAQVWHKIQTATQLKPLSEIEVVVEERVFLLMLVMKPDAAQINVYGHDITHLKQTEVSLKQERDFISAILDTAGALVVVLNRYGEIVSFNRACEQLSGYAFAEVKQRKIWDFLIPQEQLDEVKAVFAELCNGQFPNQHENYWLTKTQEKLWIAWSNTVILDAQQQPLYIIGTGLDITERRRTEQQLQLAATVFESSNEAILITDTSANIIDVNESFSRITGYNREEVVGKNPRLLKSDRHDKPFYEAMWHSLLTKGRWRGEVWEKRKNGQIYPKWLSISTVYNEKNERSYYVGIFSDITKIKQTEEYLQYLAYKDTLTGLPNRTLFQDRLEQAMRQADRNQTLVVLMFLDLDRFKNINDTLGHRIGDQLLVNAAQRFKDCVRVSDTVARLGGDEFTVILTNLPDSSAVTIVAQKLIAALAAPFFLSAHEIVMTTSIGITIYPNDASTVDDLLKNADTAMYHAKDRGRNNYQFFSQEMHARAFQRLTIESDLRRALERDEFRLYFQPQVNVNTKRITAIEALVRWQHPSQGLLVPGHFIPVAEESGLILPLGEWVLRAACQQNQAWREMGLPAVRVAVNLSGKQFKQLGLVEKIDHILAETGLAPDSLELEITESTLIEDMQKTIETLMVLRERGIQISVDDFGTGYSSLGYLKRLPINTLKIDRSFVSTVNTNPDDASIAATIIAMAHELNLRVIAEGVENEGQLNFLRERACDEAQGYLFGKPQSSEAFTQQWQQTLQS